MKAIILTASGGTENFSMEELPLPVLQPHEVLVKVHALSINPVDFKTRKGGALMESLKSSSPVILGWDVSGVIEAVGEAVSTFSMGDEVFGMVNFPGHGKAYAEYVAAPEAHLAPKPKNISHEEGAATTLAALTAWQVLVNEAKIQKGQRVLIHAAAGGVGHYAVQIAKYFGAEVTGTASASNKVFLEQLGVDHFIDYKEGDLEDGVGRMDVVLDPIGGATTEKSLKVLKNGGTLISIVGGVKDHLSPLITEKGIEAKNYLVQSSGSDMQQLADLLEGGFIKPHISQQFPFEQMAEAHQQMETSKTRGKIVVTLF